MRTISIVGRLTLTLALGFALVSCGDKKSPTDPDPGGSGDGSPAATTIALSDRTVTFTAIGDSTRLTAEVSDQQGRPIGDASMTWTSTDSSVATVAPDGWVFAVANGAAQVIVTSGTLSDTATVEVAQVPVAISVDPDSATLIEGDTLRLEALVSDANGSKIDEVAVSW